MRQIILAGVSVLALAVTQAGQAQTTSSSFDQGVADRDTWEHWTASLSGAELDGVTFWSSQRSLPRPGTCTGPASIPAEWRRGCVEAQRRLALIDVRRKSEPDYKSGWNSWTPNNSVTPQPLPVTCPPA